MKGSICVCLLLFLACNTVQMATGVEVEDADRPKPKLVLKKGDDTVTLLLTCKVKTNSQFKTFEWKVTPIGEEEKTICKSQAYANECEVETALQALYTTGTAASEKYNLKVTSDKAITDEYAGKYSCIVTMQDALATPERYDSDVTVAEEPGCSDEAEVTIIKDTEKNITCTQTYVGNVATTLKYFNGNTDTEAKDTETNPGSGRTLTYTVPTANEGSAEYDCKASAAGVDGYTDHTCTSKVKIVASAIGDRPTDKAARIGEKSVKMTCTVAEGAKGYGTFTWKKGEVLSCVGEENGDQPACTGTEADNFNLDVEAKHNLNIKEVKEASAGEYTCAVETPVESQKAKLIPITATSPECSKSDKKLICKVTYKGDKEPTVQWHKDDKDTENKSTAKDGVSTVEVTPAEGEDDKYVCKVMNGKVKAYDCKVDSGAPSLDARIYHSTLFSVVVVWLWHQLN